MRKNPNEIRRQRYFQLSSALVHMDNAQLRYRLDSSKTRAGWGKNHTLEVEGHSVFVKRIPVTEIEFSNMFSTKNHYNLPTYYNYGVGSAGFNIFRELVAHVKTTNWVLNGEIDSFPLLYHYRMMPFAGERIEVQPEQVERYVTYWGGNETIGRYRLDKLDANYELVLFLEYIPHVLGFWLMDHSDQIDRVLEQLRLTIDFLRQHQIIHFDANFDNIFTDGARVYLSDFGLVLDRNFALADAENSFFDAHTDYDYARVLANLIFPIYELCRALPDDKQNRLRAKYGIIEDDNQSRQLIAVLFEHIEEIHRDGVIQVDQAYVNCLLRYRAICTLTAGFDIDLRQNNQKDTPFPRAELRRLLQETNFLANTDGSNEETVTKNPEQIIMFDPIDLSFFADAVIDEVVSGEPKIDGTILLNLARQAQGPILELGCGYGRITIPLAQRGVQDLTGLDLSAPSLTHARARTGTLPIRWVEADVRNFQLNRQFALIFARGDVFNFMLTRVDQEAMLACVHEHLADGGQFLFDNMPIRPDRMVDELEETAWYDFTHPNGRQVYASGTSWYDHMQQWYIQRCHERWDSADGELVRPPWELTLRYIMPQDLEALLHYNGFKVMARYSDYRGDPISQEEPGYIYLCARR